jgi:hypothetical protein
MPWIMDTKRLYLTVAACAVVIYLGALWNRFAMDDLYIIAFNPLVHSASGIWRAFGLPYWPPDYGGKMYRPLVLAMFALDRLASGGSPAWFHAVNLLWHAAASVLVAVLARRWAGARAGLVAGVCFAIHPVHVEAVANVVGRAELMAALFALLAVYAALERDSLLWSVIAIAFGLLSKENAAVAPGLITWAWILGFRRPARRRFVAYAASWVVLALCYWGVRGLVLHPYARTEVTAPIFIGASSFDVRLTALAALADVARLLVFPLTLRVDYSPNEFTLVSSVFDARVLLGAAVLVLWAALLWWAWRGGRKVEAFGLGWIAIAYLPVANLLFPTGILIAERTLYLPSVGLALALGAALRARPAMDPPHAPPPPRPDRPRLRLALWLVCFAAGVRTALRVPVWRDDKSVTLSIFEDSPASYRGPARSAGLFQGAGQADRALAAYRAAVQMYDRDPTLFVGGADAAFTVGRPGLADSLLMRADQLCFHCDGYLRVQAAAARSRGDAATADSLTARALRWSRERS